jgi:hypothetical protein
MQQLTLPQPCNYDINFPETIVTIQWEQVDAAVQELELPELGRYIEKYIVSAKDYLYL